MYTHTHARINKHTHTHTHLSAQVDSQVAIVLPYLAHGRDVTLVLLGQGHAHLVQLVIIVVQDTLSLAKQAHLRVLGEALENTRPSTHNLWENCRVFIFRPTIGLGSLRALQ